jgi:hypothetical protein
MAGSPSSPSTAPPAYEAREILLNILANESAATSATDAIATAREDASSLAVLIPRYLHGARQFDVIHGFAPGMGPAGTVPWVRHVRRRLAAGSRRT